MPDDSHPDARASWEAFCKRLQSLGDLLGAPQASDATHRAEGARWLARLTAYALRAELEAGSAAAPRFFRYEEPGTQWGAPNPDNVYLRAPIDPTGRYRVWCDARGLRQAIFSLHEGDMQLEQYGVYSERHLAQLARRADGRLELTLAPDEQPENWIPMHPDARLFQVRVYQSDWVRDAAPAFHIERLDAPPAAAPLSERNVASALERAAHWVEASARYWPRYAQRALELLPANQATPPRPAAGGAENILYGSAAYDLGAGEALLIESEPPDADYWNFALHTVPWFESGDFVARQTSLNGDQLFLDGDGLARLVVAAEDPGSPNWLDTEGRPRGLLTYRYVWTRSAPAPRARVVPIETLRDQLPAGHPRTSPEDRLAALRRRREAAERRYL